MTLQIQEIIFIKAAYDISIDPEDSTHTVDLVEEKKMHNWIQLEEGGLISPWPMLLCMILHFI